MKATIKKEKNMEKANIHGEMGATMMDIGLRTRSQGSDSMFGLMAANMLGTG